MNFDYPINPVIVVVVEVEVVAVVLGKLAVTAGIDAVDGLKPGTKTRGKKTIIKLIFYRRNNLTYL
jgi:hypothetical protein